MHHTSSPVVRYRNHGNPHRRGYQDSDYSQQDSRQLAPNRHISTSSPNAYEDESLVTSSGLDTSFELMSATQLRDQLRREQQRRRDKEKEVDNLKRSTTSLTGRPQTHGSGSGSLSGTRTHSPAGARGQDNSHTNGHTNSHDSDSGISHTLSNSQGQLRPAPRPPPNISPIPHVDIDAASPPLRRSSRTPTALDDPWSMSTTTGALRNLQDGMYESEQRRLALVEKLREAHETLQRQTERLCNSEAKLNDSHYAIETLSSTNEELHKKLSGLQREKERHTEDTQENVKHKDRLQQRVEELYQELKLVKLSNEGLQGEQRKRDHVVEQTSKALDMMEEENRNFQQMKDSMIKETKALRESLQMARSRAEKLDMDNRELDKIAEKHDMLAAHNSELNSQLGDERRANTDLDHQVDLLRADFMKAREERDVFQNRVIQLDEKCADLNAKCVSSSASKERLLQEKLDLQQLLNLVTHEKEQMNKTRQALEGKLTELQLDVTQSKLAAENKDEELDKISGELNAVKKVSEVLSIELASARSNLERTQEEAKQLSSDKRMVQQQQAYWENEAKRLSTERDALDKALEQHKQEFKREREQLGEQHQTMKETVKESRNEKNKLVAKCQELEVMLQRANDDLRNSALQHQEALEEQRASCERLAKALDRKDGEITALSEQVQESLDKCVLLKGELQTAKLRQEQLAEYREEADHMREEIKHLSQEHAEDQQVIHLLEMQKDILTKGQSGGQRLTAEQLQAQVDHLRAELGLAEDKVNELKEELCRERAQAAVGYDVSGEVVPRRSARSTPIPCSNCQELADQIVKLQELNSLLLERINRMESDSPQVALRSKAVAELQDKYKHLEERAVSLEETNRQLSSRVIHLDTEKIELQNIAMDTVSKGDYDKLDREKTRQKVEYEMLKSDYQDLEARHQRFVTDHLSRTLDSPVVGASVTAQEHRDQLESEIRRLRQDNDSLQRRIDVLTSQALIADNAKKRTEDKIKLLEKEALDLQGEITTQRRQSPAPDVDSTLKSQLIERSHTINQLQGEIASRSIALENLRQTMESRLVDKSREMDTLMREREESNDTRRKLEQEKLVLEIQTEEQRSMLDQLRAEKPRILEEKDTQIAELHAECIQAGRNGHKLENDLRNMQEKLLEKDGELAGLRLQQATELDTAQDDLLNQLKSLQASTLKKEHEMADIRQESQLKTREFRELLQAKARQDLELEQSRDDNARQKTVNQRQEAELAALREEVASLREQLRSLRLSHETDTENLKERLGQAGRETVQLRERREDEVVELQAELSRKETELQRLASQTGSEMDSLEERLKESKRELTRYRDNKEKEVMDMQNEMTRRTADLQRLIEKKESSILALQDELEDEKHTKPRLMKQSMNEVEEELAAVKGELQRVNGMINIKQSQIDDQNSRLRDLESTRDELQRDKTEMRLKLEADLDEQNDNMRNLQRKMEQQRNEMTLVKEKCKALEGKQGDRDDFSKRLETKIESQEEELHALNRLVSDVQNRNKKLEQTRDTLQDSVEIYRGKIRKMEDVDKNQKKDIATLKDSGAKCTTCKKFEVQYENVLQEKETLEEENEQLHQELENLEGLINIQQQDAKKSQEKAKLVKMSPVKEEKTGSGQQSPESRSPARSGTASPRVASPGQRKVTNPLELAAALKRFSNKAAADGAKTLPSPTELAALRKSSIRGLSEAGKYDQNRRTSLNVMEARLEALKSSGQVKLPVKGILDKKEHGGAGDQPKKQARFVLPSSRKFDKAKTESPGDESHAV